MSVVLSLDAGTTGVRTLAVREDGSIAGWAYREFRQHFPRPGWVEHDAAEIWSTIAITMAEVVAGLNGESLAAIGITNQRETVVAWDRRTSQPRARAIVWQDRRTAAHCDEMAANGWSPLVRDTTGLVLDPYFSGTKIAWLLTSGGVTPDDDLAVGTIDSWLMWNLTGGSVHATEPSNASRTMLFDIRSCEWSPELCDALGVPMHVLPEVRPTSGRFGLTHGVPGIPDGIPISGAAGDQQAALFGQACFSPGQTKNTYGTGSFVLMNVGSTCPGPVEGLLTTVAWMLPGPNGPSITYALEGAIFVTGAAIGWLRDGLGIIRESSEIGPLAETCPDTEGVMFVPAFTGLGSPWWDPYARGTVVGITRGTSRAHLARAVVESIAYQTRDVVDAMTEASGTPLDVLRVDGGAAAMDLLLQLQADQLQAPVARPVIQETTALGAAYLAGLAEGVWESLDDVTDRWCLDIEVKPARPAAAADQGYAMWRRAVKRSMNWAPTGEG